MRWTGRKAVRNATPMSARNAVAGRQERHPGRPGSGMILTIVMAGVGRVIGLSVGSGGCRMWKYYKVRTMLYSRHAQVSTDMFDAVYGFGGCGG